MVLTEGTRMPLSFSGKSWLKTMCFFRNPVYLLITQNPDL